MRRGPEPAPPSSENLNHSATVNPKPREIHCLLGSQRVSGRDDMEVFGRRDGDLDFLAVLTRDCRPPAAGLALVRVDNIRLINNQHESCFSARAQARWASLDCTIANVGRPRALVHCVAPAIRAASLQCRAARFV
jgi:hypothetical protein